MGRNSRRNSSEKKQAREKNTKENKEKLDDAEHVIVEDSEPSVSVLNFLIADSKTYKF